MIMTYNSPGLLRYRWMIHAFLISVVTTAGLSQTIQVDRSGFQVAPLSAQAQTITNEQVRSYADAVVEMDESRQQAYNQISDILTGQGLDVSEYNLSCPNAQSLEVPRRVRSRVRSVLVSYCNEARTIVEKNGLTVRQFNTITASHREDEELAQRIQSAIANIQQ